ncbi:putative dehydrogenase [Flavobacterium sp. W4I14]|nr:putative dehydrogenase [Flavobacterium sp. W4I14]
MKVAIIGLGSISGKHIQALKTIDDNVEIFALRSGSNAIPVDGVQNICSLNDVQHLDFVIISNPTSLHYQTVKMVAEYGLPMMIEKPAFFELQGVGDLQDFINKNNIFTYVACNLRFHPCLEFLKRELAKKSAINEVNIYCGSYLPDWRPNRDYKEVYSAKSKMGGGVHLDLFHEIDYACWIFGFPMRWSTYTSSNSTLDIDAPDYANYLLGYEKFNINIVLNYYRRKAKRTLEVLFEDETWEVDLLHNIILNDRQEIIYSAPTFTMMDTYIAQMKYFIHKLSSSATPMNNINETIEILNICLTNEPTKG